MTTKKRRTEISILNLLFCLLVVWIHCCSHPITVLDRSSWQFALILALQRLAFVSVHGFFFLSGVKLTLGGGTQSLGRYWLRRGKAIFLPYLLAVFLYYIFFVWRQYFPLSLTDLAGYAVRGDLAAPFYFVIALAQFVLLTPLFRWLAKRWSPVILLPLAYGITILSVQYFNEVLHLFSPTLNFAYSDRVFTSYLFYYLAGCCAGQYYDRFQEMLKKNTGLLGVCALSFAAADVFVSHRIMADGIAFSCPELIRSLYLGSAILALYALAIRVPGELPALVQRMDRASYLVYLYHALVITCFNTLADRLGITKVSLQFLLRLAVVYTVTFLGCMLWQWGYGRVKQCLRPQAR